MNLLDLLFPKTCVFCGKWGEYFCPKCLLKIRFIRRQICPVCQKAAIEGITHSICQKRLNLDGLISFTYFEGPIKQAIHQLKYQFVFDLTGDLIKLALSSKNEDFFDRFSGYTIIPVPLHASRLRWRGFNQAGLLGEKLGKRLNLQFNDKILWRTRATRPQVELEGEERKKNVAEAFAVSLKSQELLPEKVLLIDDMWTTGETMRNCARVLKKAGVKTVWGVTMARNPERKSGEAGHVLKNTQGGI